MRTDPLDPSPSSSSNAPAPTQLHRAVSIIFVNLAHHRNTLYVVFGIGCLVAWLLFNFWALSFRDYFCPRCYNNDHLKKKKKLDEIKMNFIANSIMSNPKVYMDIEADGEHIGKLVFELNSSICPQTSENFRLLCTGEKGFGFKGCVFYRVIPGFCACSGDFETQNEDRKGGKSALGTKYFKDENFKLPHDKRGILSMDNFGWPDTNSSRFFVTFKETPWMNNFHVAFGSLVDGFGVLDRIEKMGILEGSGVQKGRTTRKIVIADCGQI